MHDYLRAFPSRRRRTYRRYRLPLGLLVVIVGLSLLAPLVAPYDPLRVVDTALLSPRVDYLFGTDTLGRDVLSRTLWGGRQTLGVALLATLLAIFPGLAIGLVAGFFSKSDRLLMAGLDVLLAFPALLLALAIISLIGTGPGQVALAVGIAGLPVYARVTRTAVHGIRSALYIDAAVAIGASPGRILVWHILPNVSHILMGFAAVSLSWAIMNSAALAFLGFSGDPSTPDWGVMLTEGRNVFRVAPWIAIPAGTAITLTVFAVNQLASLRQESGSH